MRLKTINLNIGVNIFKSFSDDSRIRIMYLLYKNGEMCISDLEQILDFTQTKTSRHLIYLKNSGILSFRKRDQWVYYYVKEEYMGIVSQVFSFLEKDNDLAKDQKTFQTLYANNILAIRKIHNKEKKYILPDL